MVKALASLALAIAALLPGQASACRLALALALDVSGSVNETEYQLQMSGLAAALGDPGVEAALFAVPDTPVALAVFEWSSSRYQRLVQDWTVIVDRDALNAIRAKLLNWEREPAPQATGIGSALEFGKSLLDIGPPCWNQTLDISGDGKNNDWPDPHYVRMQGILLGLRINGLVVSTGSGETGGLDAGELSAYYEARVIQGPDAFVEIANGFDDYARAMRLKLLRELKAQPVGQAPDRDRRSVVRAGLSAPLPGQ